MEGLKSNLLRRNSQVRVVKFETEAEVKMDLQRPSENNIKNAPNKDDAEELRESRELWDRSSGIRVLSTDDGGVDATNGFVLNLERNFRGLKNDTKRLNAFTQAWLHLHERKFNAIEKKNVLLEKQVTLLTEQVKFLNSRLEKLEMKDTRDSSEESEEGGFVLGSV